jgi:hypothetical protein
MKLWHPAVIWVMRPLGSGVSPSSRSTSSGIDITMCHMA